MLHASCSSQDLDQARKGFVMATDLHLTYLVTPLDNDIDPNWQK